MVIVGGNRLPLSEWIGWGVDYRYIGKEKKGGRGLLLSEWIAWVWLLEGLWQPGTTSIRMDRVGVAIGGIVAARDYCYRNG